MGWLNQVYVCLRRVDTHVRGLDFECHVADDSSDIGSIWLQLVLLMQDVYRLFAFPRTCATRAKLFFGGGAQTNFTLISHAKCFSNAGASKQNTPPFC